MGRPEFYPPPRSSPYYGLRRYFELKFGYALVKKSGAILRRDIIIGELDVGDKSFCGVRI